MLFRLVPQVTLDIIEWLLCTPLHKLESSQSPHTSAKTILFARWQHHLRFCSGFPYAPLKAMITKISKWSRIQDSFRITPKIESLVVCAMPDIPSKFQKDPSITFWVILLIDRQTDKVWQKHNLLSGGEYASFTAQHQKIQIKMQKCSPWWLHAQQLSKTKNVGSSTC